MTSKWVFKDILNTLFKPCLAARPRSSSGAVAGNPSPLLGTDYLVTL